MIMNKTNHSISIRQGTWAAFLLTFAFILTQPDKALAQCPCPWAPNGNNINNTNTGNVGIGTTTPASKLEVIGNIALSDSSRITAKSDWGNYLMPYTSFGRMAFGTGNVDRVSILYNGNVGIGTINPTGLLHLHVGSGDVVHRFSGAGNAGGTLDLRYKFESSQHRMGVTDAFGNWMFYTQFASPNTSAIGYFPGNVGIGTTDPLTKLAVVGEILSEGPVASNGFRDRTSSRGWVWYGTGDVARFWNNSFGDLIGITASGSVGIGTTTPSSKLHVVGNVTLTGTGNITASGTITAGNVVAKYQDIAEWVSARHTMSAGTVVVLDTEKSNQVVASHLAYDTRVAGVVSDSPGVILGESGEGKVMVATTGRVRVKVDATCAPIRIGDILVTSDGEGIAMRSEPIDLGGAKFHRPGTIIGKALEPLDKGIGQILVLLSLQ